MPLVIIVGIEKDKMAREVWIHQSESEGSSHCGKESPPHHLMGEVVGHLKDRQTWRVTLTMHKESG